MNASTLSYIMRIVFCGAFVFALPLEPVRANEIHAKSWRTEHGHPDLQGTWDFGTKTSFERPAALGLKQTYTDAELVEAQNKARAANASLDAPVDLSANEPVAGGKIGQEADNMSIDRRDDFTRVNGEYRTSIIIDPPDGRLPRRKEFVDYLGERKARGIQVSDGPESLETPARCLTTLPVPYLYPLPWSALLQIVQSKDHVVLYSEMLHDARVVRLNAERIGLGSQWMGDAVARFEGNTLVVHTTNFRPEQSYAAILPMSREFELVERFTRVADDELLYSFTVTDTHAYSRPFTGERTFKRAKPSDRIIEFACHEGNYSTVGILAGARKQEEDGLRASHSASASVRESK